jgi:hypothetical protein
MPSHTRRSVLATSVGTFGLLAGCSALGSSNDPDPQPYRIGGISLGNDDSVAHTLDVYVERDDEVVHWEAYELPKHGWKDGNKATSSEAIFAEEFGGCTPGFYRIAVRLDGEEAHIIEDGPRRNSAGEEVPDDNTWRIITIGQTGSLRWSETDAAEEEDLCQPPTATPPNTDS